MDAGTIVASAAVVVSVAALVYTWRQDRLTRIRAQADLVRVGAATMLAKLGRWQELATWFYSEVGPVLVETAEKLAAQTAPATVRDWTWKQFPQVRTGLLRRISDENLETVAPELGAYDVVTLTRFAELLRDLKQQERLCFEHFMGRTQQAIEGYQGGGAVATGNRLRELAEIERQRLTGQLTDEAAAFCAYLTRLIASSSSDIMERRVRLAADDSPQNKAPLPTAQIAETPAAARPPAPLTSAAAPSRPPPASPPPQ